MVEPLPEIITERLLVALQLLRTTTLAKLFYLLSVVVVVQHLEQAAMQEVAAGAATLEPTAVAEQSYSGG